MHIRTLFLLLLLHFFMLTAHSQTNRYWVGASIYRNSLTSAGNLAEWTLTNDNGTGSWSNSGTGSSILKTDNLFGEAANQLNNTIGGSPRLLPLDAYEGAVELQIVALSIGNQFSIQVDAYDAANTYIETIEILGWQSNPGFYRINFEDYPFDPSTTQIRFIIAARNIYFIQGTVELNYFNYFNTNNNWSNTANWSATSGGAGGVSLPGMNDHVFFDANSGTNAIVDTPVSSHNLTVGTSFTSGIINGGNNDIVITGTALLSGGFLIGVNNQLTVHDVTLAGTQLVSTSGTITITGDLTYVSGIFKPVNGTVVFNSSNPQVIPSMQLYNLKLEGTGAKTSTGNFSVAGNFVNNSTFSATGNTMVFNGTSLQTVSGAGLTTLNNVTITNPSASGILLTSPVNLTGVLTFTANSKLTTGGNLTLVATSPTVTGSIAAFPSGANLLGSVRIQKYIYSGLRIYRYLSPAVSGATVADWKTSIPITGTFADPSTGSGIASASPSMFTYKESIPGVLNNGYEAYPATGVLSALAPLTVGKGYSIYVRNNTGRPTVLEVNGTINKGTLTIPVTYTSSGSPADDGWNLIGNPYPSSINWSTVAASDRLNMGNAIYYQDNNVASPVYRSWVNGVGTNCSSGIISSSQAFWVKATASSPVLRLRESNKTAATPSFYRVGNDLSLLRISLDSVSSTFRDETVIRISEDATLDFDAEYDAFKLYDATHPAIGSSTKQSPLLSINAFALYGSIADTIDLFVKTIKQGNYTLSVPEYSFDASMNATLWDTYTNTKTQLLSGMAYPFEVSMDSVAKTNRFKIIVESTSLTTSMFAGLSKSGMVVYPNPASTTSSIHIYCPQATDKPIDILVYDVTGMKVCSATQVNGSNSDYSFTLPSALTSGIYSIHCISEGSSWSSTFIIK